MAPQTIAALLPWLCCLVVMELPGPARPAKDATARAAGAASPRATGALARFLEGDRGELRSYVGTRRLTARNDRFGHEAWMTVRTTLDGRGFRYEVTGEGGSDLLRRRVLRATLEAERALMAEAGRTRAALTPDNYDFTVAGDAGAAVRVALTPRLSEPFLVDGHATLDLETGELLALEGRLARNPSFWTTRVDVVRRYRRIGGVRLPVTLDSVANVRVAGRSVFRMSFEYTAVNGRPILSGGATGPDAPHDHS